jgi:ferrochelatase
MKKTAVILFNLGGPDNQQAVKPFLFNLFNDEAIIRLPAPFRYVIAKLISSRRDPVAREIYAKIGGGSPILQNTRNQAEALDAALNRDSKDRQYKCFIAMRYWHPFADAAAIEAESFKPDDLILLPLYPQFSTTTTASSLKNWAQEARKRSLTMPSKTICCYPTLNGFIKALAAATRRAYVEAQKFGTPRVLFSAHGLPEKIVKAGDPYPVQCAMTVEALRQELAIENLDSLLCFQSRVGPLKWIDPATDAEVRRAGADKVPLVVVPIAFVSDHSETLVEIDIEYRHLAMEKGVPYYGFVRTVGIAPDFIDGLADLIRRTVTNDKSCVSGSGKRICPASFSQCECEKNNPE